MSPARRRVGVTLGRQMADAEEWGRAGPSPLKLWKLTSATCGQAGV